MPTVTPNTALPSRPYPAVHHPSRTWTHHVLHLGHLCIGWFAGTVVGLISVTVINLINARSGPPRALASQSLFAPAEDLIASIARGPVWIVLLLGVSVFVLSLFSGAGWLKKIGHFLLSILLYWTISVAALVVSADHTLPNFSLLNLVGFIVLPSSLALGMATTAYLKDRNLSAIQLEDIPLLIAGFSAALAPFVYSLQFGMIVLSQK